MDYKQLDRSLTIIILVGIVVLTFSLILNYYNTNQYNSINSINDNNPLIKNSNILNETTNKTNNEINETNQISNISKIIINMSIATYDDRRFISIVKEGNNIIREDIKGAMDASNSNDLKSFQNSGKKLQRDSSLYLNELDTLNISSQFKTISYEYKLAMQKFYRGGEYIQSGIVNPIDLNISIDYVNAGLKHVDNINTIFKNSKLID